MEVVMGQLSCIDLWKEDNAMNTPGSPDVFSRIFSKERLNEHLEYELARSRRYHAPFGVIVLDIDNLDDLTEADDGRGRFKLLQDVGYLLRNSIRQVDILGRWDGESFLIICPHSSVDALFTVAEHLRVLVADEDFGGSLHLTASLGFSIFQEDDSLETLVNRALGGLARAQSYGKNRVGMVES